MGYVFRIEDARHYDDWYLTEPGSSALLVEKEVLFKVWGPTSPQRVLDVGCGTGIFLDWFHRLGHCVAGIDPSPSMLGIAHQRLRGRVPIDQGFAEDLPYEDNEFDTVALITTLEFVDNPAGAIREACRVARRHVLLGSLNKYSIIALQRRAEQLWRKDSYYRHARFYSVFELQELAGKALDGRPPLRWATCLTMPLQILKYSCRMERSRFLHWHPFGHFIAMRLDLRYPLQLVQTPLFCELPAGIGRRPLHSPCWHLPVEEKSAGLEMSEDAPLRAAKIRQDGPMGFISASGAFPRG